MRGYGLCPSDAWHEQIDQRTLHCMRHVRTSFPLSQAARFPTRIRLLALTWVYGVRSTPWAAGGQMGDHTGDHTGDPIVHDSRSSTSYDLARHVVSLPEKETPRRK